jgi:hypothetical protein
MTVADFTDSKLTPRAKRMALWLCDLANPALTARDKDASCDMLLRELPDFWTAEDATRMAQEFRQQLGPRASHCAWLTAAGWLVGEEERLPERSHQPSSHVTRTRVMPLLESLLQKLGTRPPRELRP